MRWDGVQRMTVVIMQTYMVKPEKQEEYLSLMKRYREYMETHLASVKELKSWRVFRQVFGGAWGAYVEMLEFDNMAELERYMTRTFQDGARKEIYKDFMQIVDPATVTMSVYSPMRF